MKYQIVPASYDDISEIIVIDRLSCKRIVDSDWYSNDCVNEEFLNYLLDGAGFVVKAVYDNQIIGFGMAEVKLDPVTSPVATLHLNDDISFCGEIDNILVLPDYRGYGLQRKMMCYLEEKFHLDTSIHTLYTTVHPDNIYSLRNCFTLGYQKVMDASLYGGKKRVVLEKRIRL